MHVIRFHSLVEFDEVKRSCRKRLDGHNRRRRKPQPDSLSVNSGTFLSGNIGIRYLPSSSPEMYSSWVGAVKAENYMNTELNFSRGNSLFPASSLHNYKVVKQISFVQTASSSLPAGDSVCEPILDANPSALDDGGSSSSSRKMFSQYGLSQIIDSNRALSLLSSQPAESRVIGLSPMVQSSGPASPLISNFHYNNSLGMEGEQVGTILSGDGISNNTNLHGLEMFRTGHSGASASGTHQTLSFSWE